jgi:uncharacterized SAM-binding protein YcdF (DUF218 family)
MGTSVESSVRQHESLIKRIMAYSPLRIALWAAVVAVLLVCSGFVVDGKLVAEKTLTKLTFPFGLFWLLLTGWMLDRLRSCQLAQWVAPGLAWLVMTGASCGPIVNQVVRQLETSVQPFQPERDPPLDLLVVLGGGTHLGPFRAEAGDAGDRVLYAAQLFHQGNTKRLLTTGESLPGLRGDRVDPSQLTIEIWTQLGIDRDTIETLGGRNTFEELQALQQMLEGDASHGRVGLLTSAWHLPRAIRLGRAAGLHDLVPVAADHLQQADAPNFVDFIPSRTPSRGSIVANANTWLGS